MLENGRRKGMTVDVVECTEVPTAYAEQEAKGEIYPPYLLLPNRRSNGARKAMGAFPLHKMNAAVQEKDANTRISERGDFEVMLAAKGCELLTSYGRSYWRERGIPQDLGEAENNTLGIQDAPPRTQSQQTLVAKDRESITLRAASMEARARITEIGLSAQKSKVRPAGDLTTEQEEWLSSGNTQAWITLRHRHLGQLYTRVALGLRTALYLELMKNGVHRPEILTTQGARTGTTSETAGGVTETARIRLGWTRESTKNNEIENSLKSLQQQVRREADEGKFKSARDYARSHGRKFGNMGMDYGSLKEKIEEMITHMAVFDYGAPRSMQGQTILHLCAGTAPLLALQHRYGMRVVNVERDAKPWQTDAGQGPYRILPEEAGGDSVNLIVEICYAFGVKIDDVAAILVSTQCDTTSNATSIAHWSAEGKPLTQQAREDGAVISRIVAETTSFVVDQAVRGTKVMYAFEQGKGSSFHKIFVPHDGLESQDIRRAKARGATFYPRPKEIEWGDYGAPYRKATLWTTNFARLQVIKPTHSKAESVIAAPRTKDGTLPRKLAKSPGLTIKEVKAQWPQQFLVHMLEQAEGRCVPFVQVVITKADQWAVRTFLAQKNRRAQSGPPTESNKEYRESLAGEAWIVHDETRGWLWGETQGVVWDPAHNEFRVALVWAHTSLDQGVETFSETQLHTWKRAAVSQVIRSGVIKVGAGGRITAKIKNKPFMAADGERRYRVDLGGRGTDRDFSEQDIWQSLVESDAGEVGMQGPHTQRRTKRTII